MSDVKLALNGYDLFRHDRPVDRDGGGVRLYVRSTLNAVQYTLVSGADLVLFCGLKRVSFICCCLLPNTVCQCV